jgi:bla regulator protein blaR1
MNRTHAAPLAVAALAACALVLPSTTAPARAGTEEEEVTVHFVDKPAPVYPEEAKKAGIEGTVVTALLIDAEGVVQQAEVVSGPEELRQATLEAVKQWRAEPPGKEVHYTVTTNFVLDHHEKKDGGGGEQGQGSSPPGA